MSAVKGHDMSHHWRLVSVDGGPVTGTFWVQRPRLTAATWVIAVDVTVWDEDRTWGLVLIPGDLSAMVKDGVVDLAVLRPRGNEEFVRDLHPEPQSERLSEFPQAAHDFACLELPAFEALNLIDQPRHVFAGGFDKFGVAGQHSRVEHHAAKAEFPRATDIPARTTAHVG